MGCGIVKNIEAESKMVVTRVWEVGEIWRYWSKGTNFSYKMSKCWESNTGNHFAVLKCIKSLCHTPETSMMLEPMIPHFEKKSQRNLSFHSLVPLLAMLLALSS